MTTKPIANTYEGQLALLDQNKPIRVYRNLQTGLWSVKQGVVRLHTNCIFLKAANFIVSEKGRQRVLREKQKNVHAYVMGYLTERPTYFTVGVDCHEVTYNPYKNRKFVCRRGEVESADICCLKKTERMTYAGPKTAMKVFASNLVLTEVITSDTIETVPVHLL